MKKKNYITPTVKIENIEDETILVESRNNYINCGCSADKWCDHTCTNGCHNGNKDCHNGVNEAKEDIMQFVEESYE